MRKGFPLRFLPLAAMFFSGWLLAAVELREGAPDTYTVKRGDTLWDIAGMFLQEPWQWPQIWEVNPQIDNPHLIYPGDVLALVWRDGQPRITLRRGGMVRLSPDMRVEPLDRAIPLIPLDEIGPFLARHRILQGADANASAYVVAGAQKHLISAHGDRIFARGPMPPGEEVFGIYRAGAVYRDPVTGEVLGYEARNIGSAERVDGSTAEVVELQITRAAEEIRIADRLLPNEERILDAAFQPRSPEQTIRDGYMIAVDGGVSQIGTWNIVVLNKGLRDGIEIGHVLAIYQTGEVVFDPVAQGRVSLPDVRAGLLMVFETFEKASYAIVLKANRPLAVLDKVRNP